MELKNYQVEVINELSYFLDLINERKNIPLAFESFWSSKGLLVKKQGFQSYKNNIPGVPHVCLKVPTGGGKTYIASSSLRKIFDRLSFTSRKIVVWLVPSDTILEQTVRNLNNPNHYYRSRINADFNSRVEVYTKEQLLSGQNFNSTTISEQLSILILSFDSLRSKNKEGRKVYQENGNLQQLTEMIPNEGVKIIGSAENSLIQIINKLMPVVIVDEGHNATSELSVEMLKNLNPSFVLELTATPRENSNVISYVDALKLKDSNMVKLPVIVYNKNNQQEVIVEAIDLRNKLENQAKANSSKYIRPIVLFQAQPNNTDESTTFVDLKNKLIKCGIKKEEIAIKTATINEIKGVNLLSETCEIRYIITINALKEGWDCPFAYILATLANKTSKIDVEQIVGRILRQPYTQQHSSPFLNMSYVLTSSINFQDTLENVIKGLNNAGFSKTDCRLANIISAQKDMEQENPFEKNENTFHSQGVNDALDFTPEEVGEQTKKLAANNEDNNTGNLGSLLTSALKEHTEYSKQVKEVVSTGSTYLGETRAFMEVVRVESKFLESVKKIKIPQFFVNIEPNIFNETTILLSSEKLTEGFSLKEKELPQNLTTINDKIYEVDIKVGDGSEPKYLMFNQKRMNEFKEILNMIPPQSRLKVMEDTIHENLKSINSIETTDLKDYVHRIIDSLSPEDKSHLEDNLNSISERIKQFIYELLKLHKAKKFFDLFDKEEIKAIPSFSIPIEINPVEKSSSVAKSLYEEERNDLNTYEHDIISRVVSLDNVLWWHRIIDSKPTEFFINGFVKHYPDFMVMTVKGTLILLEVKGEQLSNEDSALKVKLGKKWQLLSGSNYRYYMVFKDKAIQDAITIDNLIDILLKL
jgi:type III restriction enzyme